MGYFDWPEYECEIRDGVHIRRPEDHLPRHHDGVQLGPEDIPF